MSTYLFRACAARTRQISFSTINKSPSSFQLGDNCIQNFHLRRYIVGYMGGNLVLRRCASGVVKRDFRTYIRRYTFPNENFEYVYPHAYALLQFCLKFERCKPQKAARHLTICNVINDVKQSESQIFDVIQSDVARYKNKCIRSMFI